MPRLTSEDSGQGDKDGRRQHVKGEEDPVKVPEGGAADQGRDVVPPDHEEEVEDDLDDGDGEDDKGRDDLLAASLLGRQAGGAAQANLGVETPHHLKEADVEGRVEGKVEVDLQIAPAIASPPGRHIVVPPDEGVDDIAGVADDDGAAEDGGGKLTGDPEKPGGNHADDDGQGAEEDAEEEVDLESSAGVRGRRPRTLFRGGGEAEGDVGEVGITAICRR